MNPPRSRIALQLAAMLALVLVLRRPEARIGDLLERALRDEMAEAMSEQEQHYNALGELRDFAGMLGQRLGEMHLLLAAPTEDPAFQPRPSDARDSERWRAQISTELTHALDLLAQHRANCLHEAVQCTRQALAFGVVQFDRCPTDPCDEVAFIVQNRLEIAHPRVTAIHDEHAPRPDPGAWAPGSTRCPTPARETASR